MTGLTWVRGRARRDEVSPERTVREVLAAHRLDGLPRHEQVRAIREADHWGNGHGLGEDEVRVLREAGLLT
jgi:hypothetical protein